MIQNDNIKSEMHLFVDDSFLFTKVEGIERIHEKIEEDLATICRWGIPGEDDV